MATETYDITIQRNRPKGEPHTGADTVTYRVHGKNPTDARKAAFRRADKKWSSWTMIDQERVK